MDRTCYNVPSLGYQGNNRDLYASSYRSKYLYNHYTELSPNINSEGGSQYLSHNQTKISRLKPNSYLPTDRYTQKAREKIIVNNIISHYQGNYGIDMSTRGVENDVLDANGMIRSQVQGNGGSGIGSQEMRESQYIVERNGGFKYPVNNMDTLPIQNNYIVIGDSGIANPNPNTHYTTFSTDYRSNMFGLNANSTQLSEGGLVYEPYCAKGEQRESYGYMPVLNKERFPGEHFDNIHVTDTGFDHIKYPIVPSADVEAEAELEDKNLLNNSKKQTNLTFSQEQIRNGTVYFDHYSSNLNLPQAM